MATLATETWTGTTGAAWPAQWTSFTTLGTGGSSTLQANAGRLTTPVGSASYPSQSAYLSGMAATPDTDLVVSFRGTVSAVEQYVALAVDVQSTTSSSVAAWMPSTGYALLMSYGATASVSAIDLYKPETNGSTSLQTSSVTLTGTTQYTVRFQRIGSAIRARIWATGSSEPATWNINYTDASPAAAGKVRLTAIPGAVATARSFDFDDLTVTDGVAGPAAVDAPLSGSGTLAAALTPSATRSADLSGSGSVSASATPVAAAPASAFVKQLAGGQENGGTSSHPVTLGAAPGAGNTLVLGLRVPSSRSVTAVTDSRGNTWTQDAVSGTSNVNVVVYRCTPAIPLQAGDTVTATTSGAANLGYQLLEFAGLVASPVDQTATTASLSAVSLTAGPMPTTASAREVLVSFVGTGVAQSQITAPTGWTAVPNGTDPPFVQAAYLDVTATGAYQAAWSWSSATTGAVAVIAYKVGAAVAASGFGADPFGSSPFGGGSLASPTVTASLAGSGTLTATLTPRQPLAASLAGSGTVVSSVAAVGVPTVSPSLLGSGALSVSLAPKAGLSAAVSGVGLLFAPTQVSPTARSVVLTGSGSLSAAITRPPLTASFTGSGQLTAVSGRVIAVLRATEPIWLGSGAEAELAYTAGDVVAVSAVANWPEAFDGKVALSATDRS